MSEAVFDDMGGEFEARLKRNTTSVRTSKSDGRELTVSSPLAVIEARFSYKVLDRLYFPAFVAMERDVDGETRYPVYEVVGVSPTHYQLSGVDSSMPTLLRKEYLDTIKESWGKSQETWIDLAAVPTSYVARIDGKTLDFYRAPHVPLPGSKAYLLSKDSVEKFLCQRGGETIGTMAGFDLPFTVSMDDLVRYHCGFFAFSLDHDEPIVYRTDGVVQLGTIGGMVDGFYRDGSEGKMYTQSVEVVCFDRETMEVKWAPIQYVFRHRYSGKLLRFRAQTGRTVTVTPGHSLFTLRNGRVTSIPSDELRPGDFLVGTRKIPPAAPKFARVDLVRMVQDQDSKGVMLAGVKSSAFDVVPPTIPKWKRWRWKHSTRLPLDYFDLLDVSQVGEARLSYKGCAVPVPLSLEIDEALASLMGYYLAEGHITIEPRLNYSVTFTLNREKDTDIVTDIRRILRTKFRITPRVWQHGAHGIRVSFNHRILASFFAGELGRGAANKKVPPSILNSPSAVRRSFLRAWAAGDYQVTVSKEMMNGMMHLLLLEDTVATVVEWQGNGKQRFGDRMVNARPRYQMHFPPAEEVREGKLRTRRNRAEPIFPAIALPDALKSILIHPSHIPRSRARMRGRLLQEVIERLERLRSYEGPAKTVGEARHDGHCRTAFPLHLVKNGNQIARTQLLLDADSQFRELKRILDSDLAFFQIDSIEEVRPTSSFVYDVSVPNAENFLSGFGGIFCHNSGSGKSNLMSDLVRRAMHHDPNLRVVVIDIAGEYVVDLLDLLGEDAKVATTEIIENPDEFASSQAIPESLEEDVGRSAIEKSLMRLYSQGVEKLSLQEGGGIDLGWIQELLDNAVDSGRPGGTAAKMALATLTTEFYEKKGLKPSTRLADLDGDAARDLVALLQDVHTNVHSMSALVKDIDLIIRQLETGDFGPASSTRLRPERLAEMLAKGTAARLNVIYAPEPTDARQVAARVISRLLFLKKKLGNRQRVLMVLDEAQEYIPDEPSPKDFTAQSNRAVEQLLRQGRKYRFHCWMASQRVARLNVNALQQLHSYFVSTLPRMYDRMVIADAFALPYEVLERTADLGTGEWLFVSFKAAKQKNVPVFLRTENNETIVAKSLKGG